MAHNTLQILNQTDQVSSIITNNVSYWEGKVFFGEGFNLQGILSSMLYLLTACKQTQSVHYTMQKLCTGQELAMQGQPAGDTEQGKAQPEGLEN